MITATQMYWLTRLDSLKAIGAVMAALGMLVTGITCGFGTTEENVRRVLRNILCVSIPALALGIAICVFVPNTKEMAAILVVPRIANSESLSNMADGTKALTAEWLKELRPGKDDR